MSYQILNYNNRTQLATALNNNSWVIACLCANWCSSCHTYTHNFSLLAKNNPAYNFFWIDIEDHADLVGDFDIEYFPTLLIQRNITVYFFGEIKPSILAAQRLLTTQIKKNFYELNNKVQYISENKKWQTYGLHLHLKI